MADTINAADLVAETANTLDGSECLVGFDTTQGKKITVDQLAEYIIQKKLSSLASANQTVAAAISALNSKQGTILSFSGSTYDGLVNFCKEHAWSFVLWMVFGSDSNFPTGANRHYGFATMNSAGTYGQIVCLTFDNSIYSRSAQGASWSSWVSIV